MVERKPTDSSAARKGAKRTPNRDFYEDLTPARERRFWSKVKKGRGRDACWLHLGPDNGNGYSRLWFGKGSVLAHRAAWALARGRFDQRLSVLQKCGNKRCVRIDHLRLGAGPTGSAPIRPERDDWVRHLVESGVERKQVAARYGLTLAEVGRIMARPERRRVKRPAKGGAA